MIMTDRWKPQGGHFGYVATDQEMGPYASRKEEAYFMFSQWVRDTFGDQPATVMEIYDGLMRPKGFSSPDTYDLVKGSVATGYMRRA